MQRATFRGARHDVSFRDGKQVGLGARDGGTIYGTGVVIPWMYAGVGTALQAAPSPSKCRGDSRPDFQPGGSLCSPAAIASAAPPSIPAKETCLRSPQPTMVRMLGASGDRHTSLLLMRSSKQAQGTPNQKMRQQRRELSGCHSYHLTRRSDRGNPARESRVEPSTARRAPCFQKK